MDESDPNFNALSRPYLSIINPIKTLPNGPANAKIAAIHEDEVSVTVISLFAFFSCGIKTALYTTDAPTGM